MFVAQWFSGRLIFRKGDVVPGSHRQFFFIVLLGLIFASVHIPLFSQTGSESDTTNNIIVSDTLADMGINDTVSGKKDENFVLDTKIDYKSFDEIHFAINERKVFLYHKAEIVYGDISLKADYIEIDFSNNQVFAHGLPDSTGTIKGTPVFTESGQSFEAEKIKYNFDNKKGFIQHVITQDGEGYLHGEKIKKLPDGRINVFHGKYTTCNLKNPHYEFRYTKAQVIPNNKIVSGPAYMVIEGVPVPLFIPFGLFPNKTGQRSGLIVPSFGESANRGFYLEGGGYYWGINDYLDLTLTGDIFTSGSWAVRPTLRYAKRYRFHGSFDFNYARNILGDRDSPDKQIKKDFSIRWSHSQDPKARPNSRFSANVYIVTSDFNDYNLTNTQAYLSNTFQSSISYQTNFNNKMFLSINGNHQQNTRDNSVSISLPSVTFNTKQIYPFRRKNPVGKQRWYENINLQYTFTGNNRISTYDSLLFKPGWEKELLYGAKNDVPVSVSMRVLKYLTFTTAGRFSGKWYPFTIRKNWVNDTLYNENDTIYGFVKTDTVYAFSAARQFSLSAGLSTRLYGMYQFKKGPVVAIRHVLTPNVAFSYHPDFGSDFWGYWHDYQYDAEGNTRPYSIFEGTLFGGPPNGKSGMVSFSLVNNIEMKVRARKDTVTGTKKIVLIDNFTIGSGYDIARDSLNWNPLRLSGRTRILKRLDIMYSGLFDPYAVDSAGRTINEFEWNVNHKLFRMTNTTWTFGLNLRISQSDFKKNKTKKKGQDAGEDQEILKQYSRHELNDVLDNPELYIDWSNPWSLSITYNLRFSNTPRYMYYEHENVRSVVNSIGIMGDVNITPKWKVQFRTGYDFEMKKFSFTSIDIYRDLHCWEMYFNWVPMGPRKSWNFGINVKAAILRDLKYNRKKDFRDSYR